LLELDAGKVDVSGDEIADAHSLTPVRVLQLIRALGGRAENLYLVGCEPTRLDGDGVIGVSENVRASVPVAVKMIEQIIADLASGRRI
jgi:Ni,Fe-hydrogenase maturation factor